MIHERKVEMVLSFPPLFHDPLVKDTERIDLSHVLEEVEPIRREIPNVIPKPLKRSRDEAPLDAFISLRSKRRIETASLPPSKFAPIIERVGSPPLEPPSRPTTFISILVNTKADVKRDILVSLADDFRVTCIPVDLPSSHPSLITLTSSIIIIPLIQISQYGVLDSLRIACLQSFLSTPRVEIILCTNNVNPFTRPIQEGVACLIQWLEEVRGYVERECGYGIWWARSAGNVAWIVRGISGEGIGVEEVGWEEELLLEIPGVCFTGASVEGLGMAFMGIGEEEGMGKEFL